MWQTPLADELTHGDREELGVGTRPTRLFIVAALEERGAATIPNRCCPRSYVLNLSECGVDERGMQGPIIGPKSGPMNEPKVRSAELMRPSRSPRRRFFASNWARSERGATAVEYALMAGLLAIGTITAVSTLQDRVSNTVRRSGRAMNAQLISAPAQVAFGQTFTVSVNTTDLSSDYHLAIYPSRSTPDAPCRPGCQDWRYMDNTGGSYGGSQPATIPKPRATLTYTLQPTVSGVTYPPGDWEFRLWKDNDPTNTILAVFPMKVTV